MPAASLFFWLRTFYREFIRVPQPTYTEEHFPDLSGKVWLVTGSTSGIGLAISKILVKQNAKVYIVGRDSEKIASALEDIRKESPSAKVDSLTIDFNDQTTIRKGVSKLLSSESSLNGVIHSAGIMNVPEGSVTTQGIDQTLGVNCVASHHLQRLIDPLVLKTPGARIVWVSSAAHLSTPAGLFKSVDDLDVLGRKGFVQYSLSKALNYVDCVQWSRHHPDADVISVAVHPGMIYTPILRHTTGFMKFYADWQYWDESYSAHAISFAALKEPITNNAYIQPFGYEGEIRPDIYTAARGIKGEEYWDWAEAKSVDI